MSFLDDLQRQAAALKAQQTQDTAALARNTALAESACKSALSYFITLAAQLNVLQPTCPARYALDRKHPVDGLKQAEFRVDSRRKTLRNEEVFDHLVMHWRLLSGRKLEIVKDFLPDIEKLEPRLQQSGAQVDSEAVRHPDTGRLQSMRYTFVADFAASVRMTPLHDSGHVQFVLNNLGDFERVTFELPAIEIGSQRLDELARWVAGHPHSFLNGAIGLRRVVA